MRDVLVGDPGAVVSDRHGAVRDGDLDRRARLAPLDGVVEHVRDGSLEPARDAANDGRLERRREADLGREPLGPRDLLVHELVELHVDELEVGRLLARELDEPGHEAAHLPELAHEVAEQRLARGGREVVAACEHLDVRADARERRPELVGGVGDELALLALRLVERREHRVEARAEPRELVVSLEADPVRQVARLGDDLRLARQLRHRTQRGPGDERAERGGRGDAAERDEHEDQADPVEETVDLLERADELEHVVVADRHHELEHVRPLDVGVREERPSTLRRGGLDLVGHRERDLARVRLGDPSARVHRLDEHVALAGVAIRDLELPGPARSRPDAERARGEQRRLVLERRLDLAAQLVADEHVDEAGRERDGEGDGGRGSQRQPGAEAHDSRSA